MKIQKHICRSPKPPFDFPPYRFSYVGTPPSITSFGHKAFFPTRNLFYRVYDSTQKETDLDASVFTGSLPDSLLLLLPPFLLLFANRARPLLLLPNLLLPFQFLLTVTFVIVMFEQIQWKLAGRLVLIFFVKG